MTRPSVPVELRRVGGEARARPRRARPRAARGSPARSATSLFEQQDVVGSRRRARRGCRGSRGRGSARGRRARRAPRATLDAAVGRAAVDDDHLARRRASARARLARQSRSTRSPWWLPTTTAIVSRHRAPRARRAARRAGAPDRARGRRARGLGGASRRAYPGRASSASMRARRARPRRSPRAPRRRPTARTSSSGPPHGVTTAGTPAGERLGDDEAEALLQRRQDEAASRAAAAPTIDGTSPATSTPVRQRVATAARRRA